MLSLRWFIPAAMLLLPACGPAEGDACDEPGESLCADRDALYCEAGVWVVYEDCHCAVSGGTYCDDGE